MDSMQLASGDNKNAQNISPRYTEDIVVPITDDKKSSDKEKEEDSDEKNGTNDVTPQKIDENEAKLKQIIAQCRNIIESLKVELNEEKAKLERDSKSSQRSIEPIIKYAPTCQYVSTSDGVMGDFGYSSCMYSDCVDSKLNADENLMKYEKQLQKYQNTLNMAQTEKKNAIRKQMLTKAYRLKLLEVENQCNIELLRVKQSLQCLEPLQMIASKWKTSNDDAYDVNNYELIPRYPELIANNIISAELTSFKDEFDMKITTAKFENKEDAIHFE